MTPLERLVCEDDTGRPRLFTRAAWDTLSANQRTAIRLQRMAVVDAAKADHYARYHAWENLAVLMIATHPDTARGVRTWRSGGPS